MSDSHDNWAKLEEAVERANDEKCEVLLFAGDLIAPTGIIVLRKFKGKVNFVWGNNEMERVGIVRKIDALENFEMCGDFYEDKIDGIKIFMNHYPKFVELAAKSGDYDLCIHGHTHEYREDKIGNTILINPGTIQGYPSGESTFIIFDTQDKSINKLLV